MSLAYHADTDQLIAKYRGNLGALMQAAMTGEADPTAVVLAGMKIRSAQNQMAMQGANPPTVAQEVMGVAPQQGAPQAPPPGAGGLGAIPPAAGTPAPQGMGAPPMSPAPQGAPVGMAEGGLAALPVSDSMFEEPDNGGYAGGGLIAFSRGGSSKDKDYSDIMEWLYPALVQAETGGRPRPGQPTKYGTAQGRAQMLPSTAQMVAKRLGMDYDEDLLAGSSPEAQAYQDTLGKDYLLEGLRRYGGDPEKAAMFYHGGPNEKGWGSKTQLHAKKVLGAAGRGDDIGIERAYAPADPYEATPVASVSDYFGQLSDLLGSRSGEATRAYTEATKLSPERRKEMERDRDAAALAAASAAFEEGGVPFLSQLGGALRGASGAYGEGKKSIRAAELEGLKSAMAEEQQAYLDRLGMLEPTVRMRGQDVGVSEAAMGRKARKEETEAERASREEQAALDRELRREIEKAVAARAPSSDLETMIAIQQHGTPEQKAALVEALRLKQQYAPAAGAGLFPGAPGGQGGTGGGGGNAVDFSSLK